MKIYVVNFVLGYKGEYYNEDTIGLDILAEDLDDLWNVLETDIDNPPETISGRIEGMVEKYLGGLKYDTYSPVQIGEQLENGICEVRWTDETFRFENESTH